MNQTNKVENLIKPYAEAMKRAAPPEKWWSCERCRGAGIVMIPTSYSFREKVHDIVTVYRCRCAAAHGQSERIEVAPDAWWYGESAVRTNPDDSVVVVDLTEGDSSDDELPW